MLYAEVWKTLRHCEAGRIKTRLQTLTNPLGAAWVDLPHFRHANHLRLGSLRDGRLESSVTRGDGASSTLLNQVGSDNDASSFFCAVAVEQVQARRSVGTSYGFVKSGRSGRVCDFRNAREKLAPFNLGIDSKLRGCDLVSLRVRDTRHGGRRRIPCACHAAEDGPAGPVSSSPCRPVNRWQLNRKGPLAQRRLLVPQAESMNPTTSERCSARVER